MRFDIITIFPKIFDSYLNESLIKRAREKKIIDIKIHNLRDFTSRPARGKPNHKKVDDRPFGGGPGMVIKIEPVYRAVQSLESRVRGPARGPLRRSSSEASEARQGRQGSRTRVILFSTRGRKLDAKVAKRLSKYDQLILICGRYEGVDERVAKYVADEEISIGDYVLSGGELPALVLIETVSRFKKGFLGKHESLEEIKGSYPVFTRPEIFMPSPKSSLLTHKSSALIRANRRIRENKKNVSSSKKKLDNEHNKRWVVPKVLLSGDHKKIEVWRDR